MRHPVETVDDGWRLRASVVLAALALAVRLKLRVQAKTNEAPHGMMSPAFADHPSKVRRIVGSWNRSVLTPPTAFRSSLGRDSLR